MPGPITGGVIPSSTWANIPAASTVSAGTQWRVTDIGSAGSIWVSDTVRWRPLGGRVILARLGAQVSGIDTNETIPLQALIPAGSWQTYDTILTWATLNKTGTTNSLTARIRVGTAGTTSDTLVDSYSAMSAGQRAGGTILPTKLLSATSAQRTGSGTAGTSGFGGGSAVVASAVTITSAAANDLYISLGLLMSGATDTGAIDDGWIELVTA